MSTSSHSMLAKTRRLILGGSVLCCAAANAWAGHPTVIGSAFLALDGAVFGISSDRQTDTSLPGMRLRVGASLSPLIDLEGQFGFSFNDEDYSNDPELGVYGVYLKGYLPIGQYSSLYAAGGMAVVDVHSPQHLGTNDTHAGFSDGVVGGFSYGFGLETQLSDSLDLTADYLSYLSASDDQDGVSAVTFGLKLYF